MKFNSVRWFRSLRVSLVVASILMMAGFLVMSRILVRELSEREEARMRLWAEATEALVSSSDECDLTFIQNVIEDNRTIPLLLTDGQYQVLSTRNVREEGLTEGQLRQMALRFAAKHDPIVMEIPGVGRQLICYDDSELLKKLAWFPVVQLAVLLLFALLAVGLVRMASVSEKDKLWVGLSRETAHQLGTPISSLMAWLEMLESRCPDDPALPEMQKDVTRLRAVAERFSQIGSPSSLEPYPLADAVKSALDYMRTRISRQVVLELEVEGNVRVMLNVPLFAWIIENMCKNAVDAMDGQGLVHIRVHADNRKAYVDVEDNGRGMSKQVARRVFEPGFTTKKRGWGLGMPLVKRIVEEYHGGRIFIMRTAPGAGTAFRLEFARLDAASDAVSE